MEPTIAEIVITIILAIICGSIVIAALLTPSDSVDITEKKLKEWERENKKW